MKLRDQARGKWRGILDSLGIDKKYLDGKHGPCPFCEGTDRFRFDNKDGMGKFFCNQCGAGDGFDLLMRCKGWDFATAASEVEKIIGAVTTEAAKPQMDERQRKEMLHRLYLGSAALDGKDMASRYLEGRGVLPARFPTCLRFHAKCPVPFGGGTLPAMLAVVTDPTGEASQIHRTFLGANGKAEIENPRAMMPGPVPEGSAVRLYPLHGERLGVAEGIETAIAAAKRFRIPTWAALNSRGLEKWVPPAGVSEVVIFGDNDPKFGGQSAAYSLGHRLAARLRMSVEVRIPETTGKDWADSDVA